MHSMAGSAYVFGTYASDALSGIFPNLSRLSCSLQKKKKSPLNVMRVFDREYRYISFEQ